MAEVLLVAEEVGLALFTAGVVEALAYLQEKAALGTLMEMMGPL
jgi:hypothetical protein